jgi:hypothetical protein
MIDLGPVRTVIHKAVTEWHLSAAVRGPLSTLCSIGPPERRNLGLGLIWAGAGHLYDGHNHLPLGLPANSLNWRGHDCLVKGCM